MRHKNFCTVRVAFPKPIIVQKHFADRAITIFFHALFVFRNRTLHFAIFFILGFF